MADTKINGTEVSVPALGYADLFLNDAARQNGDWIAVPDFPNARVHTRGWGSTASQLAHQRFLEERPPHLVDGTDQFETARKLDKAAHDADIAARARFERRQILKELVLGWTGFAGIPFSKANLDVICDNENAAPFRDLLFNASLKVGQLKDEGDADRLKNFVAGLGISFDSPDSTPTKSTL